MTVNELSELEDLCERFSQWLKTGNQRKPLDIDQLEELRRLVLRANQARREVASATPGTPAYLK